MPKNDKKTEKSTLKARIYRKRPKETGIFFLLWAAFSILSFIVVFLLGSSQQMVMRQTYAVQAAREVNEKGAIIKEQIEKPLPEAFKGDRTAFVHYLSALYDVEVVLLDEHGNVLFPQDYNPEDNTVFDFSEEIKVLLEHLKKADGKFVVYEGGQECVYGAEVSLYGYTRYLYVARSLALMQTTTEQMKVRTVLIAIFVFLLSFALSSAVAGWLVRPLTEITKKAKQLAQGDFDVDFSGDDYSREVNELAFALNFARDEISKADHMQKELIANVSHDFKTPLTMIKAYASMIMEISGDIPEKRNKHAQVIVDEADRLASLVSDVLDLSKLRAGVTDLDVTTFDLSEYMREILDRFAYLQDTQGYVFVTEIEERMYVNADKTKIGQALYNLIGNAVNYTGEDKTVKISLKKQENNTIRFEVRDTGAGIKQEELSTIWDRYYRSAEAHKRPVRGTGLGLSIVKTLLEKHNLVFGVESRLGEGSVFYVVFPQVEENA